MAGVEIKVPGAAAKTINTCDAAAPPMLLLKLYLEAGTRTSYDFRFVKTIITDNR